MATTAIKQGGKRKNKLSKSPGQEWRADAQGGGTKNKLHLKKLQQKHTGGAFVGSFISGVVGGAAKTGGNFKWA